MHAGLILARDSYGRPELTPSIVAALERLLKNPRDEQAFTRMVACEVLSRWGDSRAVPVLLKALEDPFHYHELVADPDGCGEHIYRTVWWEADRALRKITGQNPIKRPHTHVEPAEGNRVEVLAAWKKAIGRHVTSRD